MPSCPAPAPAVATFLLVALLSCGTRAIRTHGGYVSAVGDPGMRRDGLRVAWEAWNFCNEVGQEAPGMGSPRGADCFDLLETSSDEEGRPVYSVAHLVSDADNRLGAGDPFPGSPPGAARVTDADLYAPAKELYLGDRCQVADTPAPWQFWMVMLKNGNLDTTAAACPENGRPARPFPQTSRFPCPAGAGCMNQPLLFHNRTALDDAGRGSRRRRRLLLLRDVGEGCGGERSRRRVGIPPQAVHVHQVPVADAVPTVRRHQGLLRRVPLRHQRHDQDSAGVSGLQGAADPGREAGRRAQQPVLPDGHGQLLEERRARLRRRHGDGRDAVQRDDHQPGHAGVVLAVADRPVPAMAHLPERQPRAPPRRSPLPLRRLPRVLLPRERGARGAAHHLLRRLQQPAGAGDPAAAAAPRVGRVRLPDGQGTGVGRRPQGVGPRRRRHVPGALLLPGPRHAAGQEAVDVARRRHGDIRQRQGRGGGVDAQWLRHPCAGQVYQVTATGQQQLLVDRHFNVTVRYAE
uniref:DUF7705 domain-containing protein n=1 Tax=Zea mays TaxID=4577 RepID=A0A804M7H6_MAIZE